MARRFFQDLEQGVGRSDRHIFHSTEDVNLVLPAVGPDVGLGTDFAHHFGVKTALAPLASFEEQIGVDELGDLQAIGAPPARPCSGIAAEDGLGKLNGQCALAATLWAVKKIGMRQTPTRKGTGERLHRFFISVKIKLRFKHQIFSNRSMLVTKMVAPPTVTSMGKGAYSPTP